MGLFGPSKARRQQEATDAANRERKRGDLKYTIKETRKSIARAERDLAEARTEGDKSREAAGKRVLNTWKSGLAQDLTDLHKLG